MSGTKQPMSALRLDGFLPYRLSVASNLSSAAIAHAYQRLFGLSIGEWRVIALLAEAGEATQQHLVTESRMDKMSISRAARKLVERRLVERASDRADRRAWRLTLSDAGRTLYAQVVPEARRLEAQLLSALHPAERTALDTMLRKIEAAALDMA
jgi:DNA-binding MarR family transcriptional regulator